LFSVLFQRAARDELAQLWLSAGQSLRAAITAASAELERQLRTQPHAVGESREGLRRIGFIWPLAFLFSVSDDDRTVVVLHIWRYGKDPPDQSPQ
jgi:hypothetical protein